MNKKQYGLLVVVALISGLLGGVVASQLFLEKLLAVQQSSLHPAKVLRAERFEVVDQDGKPRALLGLLFGGEPGLQLYDKNENGRAGLTLRSGGQPGLELSDPNGQTCAALGYTEIVTQSTGAIEKRPISSLVLFDKDRKVLWQAP